jgi:hypothetical protein
MAAEPRGAAAHERDGGGAITDALSLFASRLSRRRFAHTNAPSRSSPASRTSHFSPSPRRSRRFGDDELRVLEAALSSGGDVAAMLATRSEARRLLRERSTEAFAAAAAEEAGARLSVADFFARAFALVGDVEVRTNCSHCASQILAKVGEFGAAASVLRFSIEACCGMCDLVAVSGFDLRCSFSAWFQYRRVLRRV